MCQRRQNSWIDVAEYGWSKLSGNLMPIISAIPMAMSV